MEHPGHEIMGGEQILGDLGAFVPARSRKQRMVKEPVRQIKVMVCGRQRRKTAFRTRRVELSKPRTRTLRWRKGARLD